MSAQGQLCAPIGQYLASPSTRVVLQHDYKWCSPLQRLFYVASLWKSLAVAIIIQARYRQAVVAALNGAVLVLQQVPAHALLQSDGFAARLRVKPILL